MLKLKNGENKLSENAQEFLFTVIKAKIEKLCNELFIVYRSL